MSGVHLQSPRVIDGILREWGDILFYKAPKRGSIKTLCRYRLKEEKPKSTQLPIRNKIALTTRKAPEVMVKISGGGKNLKHIKAHLDYIARCGQVSLEDERGDAYQGADAVRDIEQSWRLSKYGIPETGERRKEAFNIVLSMPAGTSREAVTLAARNFARERFFNHQYVFATHEDEAHPHVHLCVKALDKTQVRLNPRKDDLQQWREHFAQKLREQGIEANATPRRARGVVRRPENQTIRHLGKRGAVSLVKAQREADIAQEILTGVSFPNPRARNILYARKETVHAYGHMANALASSIEEEDQQLAISIVHFLKNLPPNQSVHQQVVAHYHAKHPKSSHSSDASSSLNPPSIHTPMARDILEKVVEKSPLIDLKNRNANSVIESPTLKRVDLARLKADLNARAVGVAERYLGHPKNRRGKTWRYGSKQGSLAVTVSGSQQGAWYDFQTGEGGDMLSLIQFSSGLSDFKEVLKEAERFLGGIPYTQTLPLTPKPPSRDTDLETLKKIQKAQQIASETKALPGTLGERYLKEHRGINIALNDQAIRYHPHLKNWMTGESSPALVIPSRNASGEVMGIQAIFLEDANGHKRKGANAKLSRGQIGRGALIQQGHSGETAFAEGVETALSIAMAKPDWTVYVTFGVSNFEKAALASGAIDVIICADNDGLESGTAKAVEKAVEKLSNQGVSVCVVEPSKPSHINKWDFNDALLFQGIDKIRNDLDKAIQKEGIEPGKTHPSLLSKEGVESIQAMPFSAVLSHYVDMEIKQRKLEHPSERVVHEHLIRLFSKEAIQREDMQYETSKSYTKISHLPKTPAEFDRLRTKAMQQALSPLDQRMLVLSLLKRANEPAELTLEKTRACESEKVVEVSGRER